MCPFALPGILRKEFPVQTSQFPLGVRRLIQRPLLVLSCRCLPVMEPWAGAVVVDASPDEGGRVPLATRESPFNAGVISEDDVDGTSEGTAVVCSPKTLRVGKTSNCDSVGKEIVGCAP
jgi:hypothetical protein